VTMVFDFQILKVQLILSLIEVVKQVNRLGGCTRCLKLDHKRHDCISGIRCATYYNYGHKFVVCFTKSRPSLCWRPKKPSKPKGLEFTELVGGEFQGPRLNSVSPPITSTAVDEVESPTPAPPPLPSVALSTQPLHAVDHRSEDMDNFIVDPAPYVPHGMELEDWTQPARGRIIISGNPPRRHEEYAIVTLILPLNRIS